MCISFPHSLCPPSNQGRKSSTTLLPSVLLPFKFSYQSVLLLATHSVLIPTQFFYPPSSATHSVLLPTQFHYPLSFASLSVPLSTQFYYPHSYAAQFVSVCFSASHQPEAVLSLVNYSTMLRIIIPK